MTPSPTFAELVEFLLLNDVQLTTAGGTLTYDAPPGVLTPRMLDALRAHKIELIDWLLAGPGSDGVVARAPVAYSQQRLWNRHHAHPHPAVYNIRYDLALDGRLDVSALGAALNAVVARHSALRTRVVYRAPSLVQEVLAHVPVPLLTASTDPGAADGSWAGAPTGSVDGALNGAIDGPFDLSRPPLLRARLAELGRDRWLLRLVLHHMICDHASIEIMLTELAELYRAAVRGGTPALDPSPPQYADYARWQRRTLADPARRAELLAHWRAELAGAVLTPALRYDRPRPAVLSGRGASHEFAVPPDVVRGVEAVARACASTPHAVLLTAFATLLGRTAASDDIVVISSFGSRLRPEHERIVGFFTDAIPVRVRLGPPFPEVVTAVTRDLFTALDHQPMPIGLLAESLGATSRPVPTVLFTVLSADEPQFDLPDVQASVSSRTTPGVARMELYVILAPRGNGLGGHIEYSTDLFDAPRIARHADNLVALLTDITTSQRAK